MPKAPTTIPKKATKVVAESKVTKTKREPSAYNKFVSANMAKWRADHPDVSMGEAMKAVAGMWRDSDENPNRGKVPKTKKKKEPSSSETEPSSDGPSGC